MLINYFLTCPGVAITDFKHGTKIVRTPNSKWLFLPVTYYEYSDTAVKFVYR